MKVKDLKIALRGVDDEVVVNVQTAGPMMIAQDAKLMQMNYGAAFIILYRNPALKLSEDVAPIVRDAFNDART